MRLEDIEEGKRLLAEYERLADDLKKAEEAKMELGQDYAEEFEARSSAASWLLANAPALLAAAEAAAWRPISEATPFDRVLVSGGQKPHGTVAGYWWWHEDDLDASGIPLGHPNATHWRPIGPLPGDQS